MLTVKERREKIATLAASQGHTAVTELAERFNVTQETIRRDLKALEKTGVLQRVHGGAVTTQTVQNGERPYWASEKSHQSEKHMMASLALNLLPDDACSIFVDSGTSTAAFATTMASHFNGQRWTIVTNSLPVGMNMAAAGIPGVNILGGTMRPYTRAVVGEQAIRTLGNLRADLAFMGTNGLSADHGLSTPDPTEAAIKRAMIASANTVVLLADSSKFGQDFLVTFADLADIDIVVTDPGISETYLNLLHSHNVKVVFA